MAVLGGLLVGAAAAFGLLAALGNLRGGPPRTAVPPPDEPPDVALFGLDAAPGRLFVLLPAGPDGGGEAALSRRLFPSESPARRLASLWAANRAETGIWEVDIASVPIRVRAEGDDVWRPVEPLSAPGSPPGSGAVPLSDLAPADALRVRALGGGRAKVSLGPRSAARILVALPAGAEFSTVSGVQWGERELSRVDVSLRDFHALREDPARIRGVADADLTERDPVELDPVEPDPAEEQRRTEESGGDTPDAPR